MAETKHTRKFYNTDIPEDWEVRKFEKIAIFFSGGTPRTTNPKYYSGHIPFIKSGEIYFEKTQQSISEEGLNNSSAKMVIKGDLLYALYGANSGEVAISKINGAINQAILCIRPNIKCDTIFIYNYLQQQKDILIRTYLQGGQGNLSAEIVKSILIPLPPLAEQKAIARVLGTWDRAIQATEKLIAQKELRKKWLMQMLLTGKKRLPGFEGKWKEYSFGKLLKVVKRPVTWNDNELYKLISVRRRSGGIFFREALNGHQIKVKTLYYTKKGDFLFSKMQIVHGASALVTKEFDGAIISGSYIATVDKDPKILNINFFNWYSQLPYFYHQTFISSYGVHIEKMTFDFNSFLNLKIYLPKIDEQTAIARVLQAADREIGLLRAKADKLREQKKGLMQLLLTGKKRLKID